MGTVEDVQASEKRMNEAKAPLERYTDGPADEPPDHELHLHLQLLQKLRIATDEYAKQVATFTPELIPVAVAAQLLPTRRNFDRTCDFLTFLAWALISRLIWNYRVAATAANQVNLLADHRLESVFFDAIRAT